MSPRNVTVKVTLEEVVEQLHAEIAERQALLESLRQRLELSHEVAVLNAVRGAKKKPVKARRAAKGKRPTTGAKAPVSRGERKAQGLKLLAEGKTVPQVAEALGVTSSIVYLWRKRSA